MSEENAELEALEEIESTLNRHWMRKPRKLEDESTSTSEALSDDAGDEQAEATVLTEDVPESPEMTQETTGEESGPISVIDYGIKRAMRERSPAAPDPVKRGRGRPRKVR